MTYCWLSAACQVLNPLEIEIGPIERANARSWIINIDCEL